MLGPTDVDGAFDEIETGIFDVTTGASLDDGTALGITTVLGASLEAGSMLGDIDEDGT